MTYDTSPNLVSIGIDVVLMKLSFPFPWSDEQDTSQVILSLRANGFGIFVNRKCQKLDDTFWGTIIF